MTDWMNVRVLLSQGGREWWETVEVKGGDSARAAAQHVREEYKNDPVTIKQILLPEEATMGTAKTEAPPVAGSALDGFRMVALGELVESKTNPRRHFDKKADDALADSVKKQGVLQAILVREVAEESGAGVKIPAHLEIVSGTRRFRAAKAAGLPEIPVRVVALTDQQALEVQITENLQRQDVHGLDEAASYGVMLGKMGYTVEQIAQRVSKTREYVVRRLKLLDLEPKIATAFLEGEIELGHAMELSRLTPADQMTTFKEALFEFIGGGQQKCAIPVSQLSSWIRRSLVLDLAHAPWDARDEQLTKAGSCANCPKRSGAQPDLFGDLKGKNLCTDRACFALKRVAFLKRAIDESEKKGEPLLRLSENYRSNTPDVVGAEKWTGTGGKKCGSTRKGIMEEAYRERIGAIVEVCTDPRCPTHRGHTASDPMRGSQKKERQESECRRVARKTVLLAALQKVKSPTRKDLELACEMLVRHGGRDNANSAADLFGWIAELREDWETEQKKKGNKKAASGLSNRFDPDVLEILPVKLKTMSDDAVARFLVAASLAGEIKTPSWWADERGDVLMEHAKERGVDVAAIQKAVEKEFREKWAAEDAKKKAREKACETKAIEEASEVRAKVAKENLGKKPSTPKSAKGKMRSSKKPKPADDPGKGK